MPKMLDVLKIGKKNYFVDYKLGQIRNVKNPYDIKPISFKLKTFNIVGIKKKRRK